MAESRHLARAPITEALIDFRIVAQADAAAIEAALAKEKFGYQRVGPIFSSEFGVSLKPEETSQVSLAAQPIKMLGARLHSPDQKYVAQFSIEGFTLIVR